jgi:hypothetical protein
MGSNYFYWIKFSLPKIIKTHRLDVLLKKSNKNDFELGFLFGADFLIDKTLNFLALNN